MQAHKHVRILLFNLRFPALRQNKCIVVPQEQEITIACMKPQPNPVPNTVFRITVHIHYPGYQIISDQSLIPM